MRPSGCRLRFYVPLWCNALSRRFLSQADQNLARTPMTGIRLTPALKRSPH
jgi:hypothetical protein